MNTKSTNRLISEQYRKPVMVALCLQTLWALLCLVLLDFGETARVCAAAMTGFWIGVGLIWFRRPWQPTKADLGYIRWGFVPAFLFALCFAAHVASMLAT